MRGLLGKDNAMLFGFLEQDEVNVLLKQHFDGVQNRRLCIWSLLSVENFMQQVFV